MKKKKEKQKKIGNGFGLRLTFAILALIMFFIFFRIRNSILNGNAALTIIINTITFLIPICSVLGFVSAFAGKKHEWANIVSIVLGAIFSPAIIGIFAIVGGVKGRRPWVQARAEERERVRLLAKQTVLEKANGESEAAVDAAEAVAQEEEAPEFIQPKMGAKGKKVIMIVLSVSYALLLLIGILLASVPAMGKILSGMGICDEISARAYGITIGVMWVALVPSFGYYFATVSPLSLSKKVRIIIAAACAALSVVMTAVFFIIINSVKIEGLIAVKEFYEGSDSWFIPVSMVFAELALMICHALTLFKINPAKIRNRKPEKCGDGFVNVMKHVLALLVYGVLWLVKSILTFKEKQPDIFILISTVLLTWLAHFASFVFAIICIAVLIVVVVMLFAGLIKLSYGTTPGGEEVLTVDGKRLTEQPYVTEDRNQKVYKDDNGNEYVSDDGGKTVSEYHRYDD